MRADAERAGRIKSALTAAGTDAVVCALPANVLLLSGYWPVVGASVAVATRTGSVHVLAPEDEKELAGRGRADEVRTFSPGSLSQLTSAADVVRAPLCETLKALGLARGGVIGYEAGECFEPAPYAALHLYGSRIERILEDGFPSSALLPADALLASLRSTLALRPIRRV